MLGIFLDRDGTLIIDKHYLHNPSDVELIPGVAEAIKIFKSVGCKLFLFSNQSGVARGFLTLEDVRKCNEAMFCQIGLGDIFDDICIATEGPCEQVIYRKPSPKFINEMVEKYSLDRSKCFMIGDKACDILAGINAGVCPIFVRTGQSCDEVADLIKNNTCREFRSLLEFAKFLQSENLQVFLEKK